MLLRGASAAQATPWVGTAAPPPRRVAAAAAPAAPPAARPERPERPTADGAPVERRASIRRAADLPAPGAPLRLGDVYAEELARLRERAHAEGYAAGYAEGVRAADAVVARAEAAATARLDEARTRWERRLASGAAALGDAVRQLEEAVLPVTDDVRDTMLSGVITLVEDLLGRELATAEQPGLDALRRALTLCPDDAPVVVRLHPDDLAEIPAAARADLPGSVTLVGDPRVERAGAVAETGPSRIDARIGPALERVQAVLAQ